jgi:hypothetical protein
LQYVIRSAGKTCIENLMQDWNILCLKSRVTGRKVIQKKKFSFFQQRESKKFEADIQKTTAVAAAATA